MLCLQALRVGAQAARPLERRVCSVVQRTQFLDFGVANEPTLDYRAGSGERAELQRELARIAPVTEEVPIVIGSEQIREGPPQYQEMPHDHSRKVAQFYYASPKTIQKAIDVAVNAQIAWDKVPFDERVRIFACAADMIATTYRQSLNAATMLGQSKTVIQAEIDAACELVDFFRWNVFFVKEASKYQPFSENPSVTLNSQRFRGIDGFIAAISPFNFTAIGGNLAYTPALMGNSVLWKPSDNAVLSNWRIFNIMREAGLPDGLVNFVPSHGKEFGTVITSSNYLSGINFTGSVPTFNWLWDAVGKNLPHYRNYPRLVGECGGKNYHFVHPSTDIETAISCTIRSAFEYCGQKCSACSRLYIPASLYQPIIQGLLREREKLKVGDPQDFSVFMGAVINKAAFERITGAIEGAKKNPKNKILGGGEYDCSKGYFIQPTIIETSDPHDKLMTEELFGPVLAVYVYEDQFVYQTLQLVHTSTPFALTGALFATDECFLTYALDELRYSAGNMYINDKSTGAVVGQQPFGGGRMSGTNDKAGGPNYVLRWNSAQAVKETFVPLRDIDYPYMRD